MVGCVQQVEEVKGEPGEYPPLVGYRLGEDDVVGGDPVCGNEQEPFGVDLVDFSDFTGGDVR